MTQLVRAARSSSWRLPSATRDCALVRALATRRKTVSDSSRKEAELTRILTALRAFHRNKQHIVVPFAFQIPETAAIAAQSTSSSSSESEEYWPEDVRGLHLGRQVRRLVQVTKPEDIEELEALGFPVGGNWTQFYWRRVTLQALRTYERIEGHLCVPRAFIAPHGDERWPRPTWGYHLGGQVNKLRTSRETLAPYQIEDLDRVGFVWNIMDHKWDHYFVPSLRRFHELHGHTDVPQAFVVPSDDPNWPRELAGWRLGKMINKIRSFDAYLPQVDRSLPELAALDFSFSIFERSWSEKILPSIRVFRRLFGHCNIALQFVVPSQAPWPEKAWDTRLGFIVQNIRGRGDFFQQVARDSEELEKLGFIWNRSEAKWKQQILPSLQKFVKIHGHADVPLEFVVPAAKPWPAQAGGLKLGRFVHDLEQRSKFADYIEIDNRQLEELGFFWSFYNDDEDLLYEEEDGDADDDGDEDEDEEDDDDEEEEEEEDDSSSSDEENSR